MIIGIIIGVFIGIGISGLVINSTLKHEMERNYQQLQALRGSPARSQNSFTKRLEKAGTLWYGIYMSNYEDGFADGIRACKDDLLEWADTFEGDPNGDNFTLFYEKLIELLEQ